MSFASFAQPATAATRLLRGQTLLDIGKALAVVVGAGVMGAVYQLTHEEAKLGIHHWRTKRQLKARRHELLLMTLLGSELAQELQDRLLNSRDAFKECLRILIDPEISKADKDIIRAAFQQSINRDD